MAFVHATPEQQALFAQVPAKRSDEPQLRAVPAGGGGAAGASELAANSPPPLLSPAHHAARLRVSL